MKCQLVSIIKAGRRQRRIYVYPLIWSRALSRDLRWYLYVLGRLVRGGGRISPGRRVGAKPVGVARFTPGDWVRIRSRVEIEALEQGRDIGDVVAFIPAPMSRYCGGVFRVGRVLEHYYDELLEGLARAEDAVLLEDVRCDGSQLGPGRQCERECLHFWKSSWLEPAAAPGVQLSTARAVSGRRGEAVNLVHGARASAHAPEAREWRLGDAVRVRDRAVIERSLDEHGSCDGIPFVTEHMSGFCGRVFLVKGPLSRFFDEKADYTIYLSQAYVLSGVSCHGDQGEGEPRCDRGCLLAWHAAWLEPACGAGAVGDSSANAYTREVRR